MSATGVEHKFVIRTYETHLILLSLCRDGSSSRCRVPLVWSRNILVNCVDVASGGRIIFQSESKLNLVCQIKIFDLHELY